MTKRIVFNLQKRAESCLFRNATQVYQCMPESWSGLGSLPVTPYHNSPYLYFLLGLCLLGWYIRDYECFLVNFVYLHCFLRGLTTPTRKKLWLLYNHSLIRMFAIKTHHSIPVCLIFSLT